MYLIRTHTKGETERDADITHCSTLYFGCFKSVKNVMAPYCNVIAAFFGCNISNNELHLLVPYRDDSPNTVSIGWVQSWILGRV